MQEIGARERTVPIDAEGRAIRIEIRSMPRTVPLIFVKTSETFGILVNRKFMERSRWGALWIGFAIAIGWILNDLSGLPSLFR